MKRIRIFFLFSLVIVISGLLGLTSCSSTNEVAARQGLMMPEKSDLPRNSKYKPSKKKKTYGAQHKKKKKKRR